MPVQHAVDDHAGHRIVDRSVRDDETAQDVDVVEALEGTGAAPRRGEGVGAAVAEVERDGDPGFGEVRPDRIVERIAEGASAAARGRYRRRADVHHTRAALDQRAHLGERRIRVGERQHGNADQAPAMVEAPVVLEPAVERGQARHRGRDVVTQRFGPAPR
jgi:hypothetical protein